MPFRTRFRPAPIAWSVLAIATIGQRSPRPAQAAASADPPTPPTARPATGRIEGTVEISASLTARRPQFRIYADPGSGSVPPPAPRPTEALAAEVHNVVIYLEGDSSRLPGTAARLAAARRGRIVQHDERFSPHVLAAVAGATIDFPNDDDFYHNVFSLSSAAGPKGFDLGRYPKGTSRSWTFPKPGTVQVFCHIHSDMSATLLILSNPFFATPDEDRHYVIDDVPEGEYTIVAWHERVKPPIVRRIRVVAGQTTTRDFNIPLPQGESRE
jgi:plastocyanin